MRIGVAGRYPIWLFAVHAAAGPATTAVVLDRIAVVVGKHVIKTSDIARDIRLTAFINRDRLDFGAPAKRRATERLIDQELIRQELINGGYRRPPEDQGDRLLMRLIRDRFGGSEAEFRQALARYGITASQLRAQLLWQATVLQFINERFRAGVFVPDSEVEQYYRQHQADLEKQNPGTAEDKLEAQARDVLEGEQVDRSFQSWLDQVRKQTRIEYKREALP